jgi:hypothetical protein
MEKTGDGYAVGVLAMWDKVKGVWIGTNSLAPMVGESQSFVEELQNV